MLYDTILNYCKSKKIKMTRTYDVYFLHHHSDKVVIKKCQKDIIVEYKDKTIKTNINNFISTLNNEIKKVKQLNKFSHTSRPKKWRKNVHRNKITEQGRESMMNYVMRQNQKAFNRETIST